MKALCFFETSLVASQYGVHILENLSVYNRSCYNFKSCLFLLLEIFDCNKRRFAYRYLSSEGIILPKWNPHLFHCVHNIMSQYPISNPMNPAHVLVPYSLKICAMLPLHQYLLLILALQPTVGFSLSD
jgi:hypothetical protein